MAELTKERLEEIHAEYSKPNHSKSFSVKDSEIAEMARQLLAGLEQDPVYQVLGDGSWTDYSKQQLEDLLESKPSTLFRVAYAAPQLPQPAVPGEIQKLKDGRGFKYVKDGVHYSVNYANGWNQCRAAMLQGAEPASNHEELPLDYLQGQKDGLEWAAQLAEANHPQTGDWLYDDPLDLAKAIRKGPDIPEFAGPHPVTPDGWISCSDRMPEDTKMLLAFSQGEIVAAYWNWVVNPIDYKKYRAFTYLSGNILDDVTHWMPLPEPPQEMK